MKQNWEGLGPKWTISWWLDQDVTVTFLASEHSLCSLRSDIVIAFARMCVGIYMA